MAYDETLAARIRSALAGETTLIEKKMFGGLCFMVDGRMCCGLIEGELIVRVPKHAYSDLLTRPHVRVMDFSGRAMRGFVCVDQAGVKTAPLLRKWLTLGLGVARTTGNPKESLEAPRKRDRLRRDSAGRRRRGRSS